MTSATWTMVFCLILGIASTLVGGVFLAFSDFVMRGLGTTEPTAGIAAMQQINRVVYRSIFLTTFMILVPASLGLSFWAWWFLSNGTSQSLIWTAAGIYFFTVFLVTAFGNVPMNQQLDSLAISEQPVTLDSSAKLYWELYLSRWTIWNHIRTVGSIAAAICYFAAVVLVSNPST